MAKILVTGGAGFIGSHTVVELVNSGHEPVIVDNFSNSSPDVIDRIQQIVNKPISHYELDITDSAALTELCQKEKFDGIIHFAALKSVADSVTKPLEYYHTNVAGLLSVFRAMEAATIPCLVFSSSATVYGEPDSLPITEAAPTKPATSPYGSTKQMCETIIRDQSVANKNIKAIALRYFNPVGAHSSGLIGELPKGTPANLIPFVTQATAGLRDQLTVHGNDYNTPDGTCIRDYIHVVDLAKAHIKALGYLEHAEQSFEVCNIGTGQGNSVLEVITTFEKVNDTKVPYQVGPRRAGDVVQCYAAVDKAKQLLNWQAELSLEDALRDAWNWQKQLEHHT